MAKYNYFDFTANDIQDPLSGGVLSTPIFNNAIAPEPDGILCQPGNIVKLSPGDDYSDTEDYIKFYTDLDQILTVYGLTEQDWNKIDLNTNNSFKKDFIIDWMKFLNLGEFIDDPIVDVLLTYFEVNNIFKLLSGPSVAYVNQDIETQEVTVRLNSYSVTFWFDWITDNITSNYSQYALQFKRIIKPAPHFVTHIAKIEYSNTIENTWSFDALIYNEYTGPGVTNSSLSEGGGKIFSEIKLAGLYYTINNNINVEYTKAKYIAKKNLDPRDPTFGRCSGDGPPFCIGDQVFIVDTSIVNHRYYSGSNIDFTWTWIGTSSTVDRKWYIANVSNPCTDYTNVPISEMLFPLRAISECKFENFN